MLLILSTCAFVVGESTSESAKDKTVDTCPDSWSTAGTPNGWGSSGSTAIPSYKWEFFCLFYNIMFLIILYFLRYPLRMQLMTKGGDLIIPIHVNTLCSTENA